MERLDCFVCDERSGERGAKRAALVAVIGVSAYLTCFSSVIFSHLAPHNTPLELKLMLINFPNLLLLSLRNVRALPNDSRIGFDSSTCFSIEAFLVGLGFLEFRVFFERERTARYFIAIFEVQVFPAPDFPMSRIFFLDADAMIDFETSL